MMPRRTPPAAQRFAERHWPAIELLVACLATGTAWLLLGSGSPGSRLDEVLAGERSALYGTTAAVAGSLLGFVLAAAAIILAMGGTPRLGRVTGSNQYGALWALFLSATRTLGVLTLWSLAALIGDKDGAPVWVLPYGVLLLTTLAALQVATCIWALGRTTAVLVRA